VRRPDESVVALRKAVALAPDHAHARVMLARCCERAATRKKQQASIAALSPRNPIAGTAWWGLADLKTSKLNDADIGQITSSDAAPHG